MPPTAHQNVHKLESGSVIFSNSRRKKSKINIVDPEIFVFIVIFIWLVVCIQFYRSGVIVEDALPPPPTTEERDVHNLLEHITVASIRTPDHFMAFSTACSLFQDWQSFIFFYHAYKVSQPGYVTRIASGCSQQQQEDLTKFHESVISKLSPNFSVHFTPDFSHSSGDDYKYYNKPFGLQHWLQHGLKYEEKRDKYKDAIFMVLDPDMMLLRPLTYDFTDSNIIIHNSIRGVPSVRKVLHGQPWASIYGFGNGPFRVDMNYVFANITDSPALRVTEEEKVNNYAGGPPYIATGADMYAIVNQWCSLVVRVHRAPYSRNHDDLLDEMFGWSLAVAHLSLPHILVESFMISNTDAGDEGWPLIDALNNDELCEFPMSSEKRNKLPYVIHYCQNYWLGKWFIGKYRLASDWLSCERPLLLEPPKGIGQKYDFYIRPGGVPYGTKEKIRQSKVAMREQFMICQLIARFNDAATWIKHQTCEEGKANYEKSFIFHFNLDPDNNNGGEKQEEP